jgi:uncharacterized membrane protein YfcA
MLRLSICLSPPVAKRSRQAMISTWVLPLLFLTGLCAGFVDSIAGGGGLITLPVLLNAGIPPAMALGTNKLQATFGSASATLHFARAKLIDSRTVWLGVLCTAIGAWLGTACVQQIDPAFLKRLIPFLLLGIALWSLLRPNLGAEDVHARMGPKAFHISFGFLLGFYDGFLGPGTGTFWAMAYMAAAGFNITRATAHTKLMNLTSNVVSLLLFFLAGHIVYSAGLAMGFGQMLGARLGSRVVIRNGARFIRPVFITAALALTCKLLYDSFLRH